MVGPAEALAVETKAPESAPAKVAEEAEIPARPESSACAAMAEACLAMGLTLSGAASIPAPDSRHAQMATLTGKRVGGLDFGFRDQGAVAALV